MATAVAEQVALNQAMLSMQLNYASQNSSATADVGESRANMAALPIIPGAPGYMPIIQNYPTGAMMNVQMAVVSPDRRYVRVTTMPFFSQIGQVTTFNVGSGATRSGSRRRHRAVVPAARAASAVVVPAAAVVPAALALESFPAGEHSSYAAVDHGTSARCFRDLRR